MYTPKILLQEFQLMVLQKSLRQQLAKGLTVMHIDSLLISDKSFVQVKIFSPLPCKYFCTPLLPECNCVKQPASNNASELAQNAKHHEFHFCRTEI